MNIKNYSSLCSKLNNLQTDILENRLFRGDRSWNYTEVTSSFNRMYFVISGEGYLKNCKHKVMLQPGNVYMIPLNSTYTYVCDSQIEKFYLHFNAYFLPGSDIFYGLRECIYVQYPIESMLNLLSLLDISDLPSLMSFKTEFFRILGFFMEKSNEQLKSQWKIDAHSRYMKLLELVSKQLSADLKISDLAKRLNVSYYSLSRNFKRDMGIGLNQYIQNMIVTKAKHLLLTTELSISEISTELNFCDQYYFSRFFKKQVSVAPREYRQKNIMRKKES